MAKENAINKSFDLDDKTFNKNKWIFSSSGLFRDALYALVSTYFLTYVQFGIQLTATQFVVLNLLIGILGRIWDGINDPMMGAIIDGSNLKMGKFRPWILIGALFDSFLTILLFHVRPENGWTYVALISTIYLFFEATFTMNDIGYWSMIPSMSRSKERRDSLTTAVTFFAAIGAVTMVGIATLLSPGRIRSFYLYASVAVAVGVLVSQTIVAFTVKEAPREESELSKENGISMKKMIKIFFSNKQLLWMGLALLFLQTSGAIFLGLIYNVYYLEVSYDGQLFYFTLVYGVLNIVGTLIYPVLAKKFSRNQIIKVCGIIQVIGYLGFALCGWLPNILPLNIITVIIFGSFIYGGYIPFYTATLINMSNCVEYNEYTTGERNEAVVSTMRPLIVKFGDAIKYLICTLAIVMTGLFGITNQVSSLETHSDVVYNKIIVSEEYNTWDQKRDALREYLDEFNEVITIDGTEDVINKKIETDYEMLNKLSVDAQYLNDYSALYLVEYDSVDENGAIVDKSSTKAWKLSEATSLDISDDKYYKLVVKSDQGKALVNAADDVYDTTENVLAVRIGMRIMICIVPAIFVVCCSFIERKKFIIDEAFFEKMTKEMEEKNKA